jgi:hypothetical protein
MAEPLTTRRLVLCEGIDDAEFLRAFISARALGAFDIRPARDVGSVSGITGFHHALIGAVSLRNFSNIDHVALVADCDTHYGNTLKSVCLQIEKANVDETVAGRYGVPDAAYKAVGGIIYLTEQFR